jgi:hypothetical protein
LRRWIFIGALVFLLFFAGVKVAPFVADFGKRGRRLTTTTPDDLGIIQESPAGLAAKASAVAGRPVSLRAYAVARMLRSEAGERTAEKPFLVGVAVNDARKLGWPLDQLMLFHTASARAGKFGKQISGRYATTKDPYEIDLTIAESVLGEIDLGGGNPAGSARKFVHKNAFGIQEGTRTFSAVTAEWAMEGLFPMDPGTGTDLVLFGPKAGLA